MLAEGEILKTWFYQASSIYYGVGPALSTFRPRIYMVVLNYHLGQ
jgi:hypothetical protein